MNHKILDLAGDFLLSGYRVLGKVDCYQGGHELTNLFLRKMFVNKSDYQIIELENFKTSSLISGPCLLDPTHQIDTELKFHFHYFFNRYILYDV